MGRQPKANLTPELSNLLRQIGSNLHELRLARNLTQAALAAAAKISVTTINEIEHKRFRDIRLSTLTSLAMVLSVPVIRLLTPSDIKASSKDQARLLRASEDIVKIVKRITDHD